MNLLFAAFVTNLLPPSRLENVMRKFTWISGPFSFQKSFDDLERRTHKENGQDHINAFTARSFFRSLVIWIFICAVTQACDHTNVINVTNHLLEGTLFYAIPKFMKIKMTIEVLTMTKILIKLLVGLVLKSTYEYIATNILIVLCY